MRRIAGLAMIAAAALASIGAAPKPAAAPRPAGDWATFRDGYIEGVFRISPNFAIYQGVHRYDGQLPDWSSAGLDRLARFYREQIAGAARFSDARLTPAERFERAYLVAQAKGMLFLAADADFPHRNPSYYVNNGLDPNTYIARPYAPPLVRMRALTQFLRNIPRAAAQIRANLRTPMPASFVDYGVSAFGGFADFYGKDAVAAFADVKDAAAQADLKAAGAGASAAMRALTAWVEAQRGTATQDFALGPARFSRMLADIEMVDTPLDELEAIGRADLARNQAALADACARYAPGATIVACTTKMNDDKPAGGPVAAARRQVPDLRAFVLANKLVTIPGTEQAKVEESPPYNRQNSAYIDPPGPFDKGLPSVYYISPPDPAWSKAVQDAFVPGRADLLFTTVHEVMPGHFVQFLHSNRVASPIGRVFVGYAFAEGWAHYAEQMMWEAGPGRGDAETHIGQLTNALLRDCRLLSAIGLHARGMTQDQSRRMFVEQCYQDEGNARQQAARGTYDPQYLSYTMGKLMILKLRDDWTATHGGRAAWGAFHDRLLSYGGPPLPLVRQAMMGEAAPHAVFAR